MSKHDCLILLIELVRIVSSSKKKRSDVHKDFSKYIYHCHGNGERAAPLFLAKGAYTVWPKAVFCIFSFFKF